MIKEFIKELPEASTVIGYGSGVVQQQGYDYGLLLGEDNSSFKKHPMIDLLVVSQEASASEFLKENYERNRGHFSGLGYWMPVKYC